MPIENFLAPGTLTRNLVVSGFLLLLVVGIVALASYAIRRSEWASQEARRRWLVMARNSGLVLYGLGLLAVWAEELRLVALSAAAIVAAILITNRELFLCLAGGIFRYASGTFRIGDRISVASLRGDVVDVRLLTTTLLEVGPGTLTHRRTGRGVVIPNALFLTNAVVNETMTANFILHAFVVPLERSGDWRGAEERLLAAANEVCAPYIGEARTHFAEMERHTSVDAPAVEPRISVALPSPDRIDLIVRVPTKTRLAGRVEQEILRRYLAKP